MIAVMYINQNRFQDTTKNNHKLFFDELRKISKFKIYDFSGIPRINCPYNPEILEQRGNLQLWDLAVSIDKVKEDLIIKLRTDLWFTHSAIQTVISEIKQILKGTHDVSFLGHNFKKTFAEKYLIETEYKNDNVRDLIVIFKKTKIHSSTEILKRIKDFGHIRSGNKIHGQILKPDTKAVNIYCQLYLVRENLPPDIDPWLVCYKFIESWNPKKAKDAMAWILTMKDRYIDI